MPTPTPPVALKDHCSIIYNNTLYTYQSDAFQSLPLTDGAKWSKLPMGVPTNGSTCTQGTTAGEPALFVVGGSTSSPSPEFPGLQWYIFKENRWENHNLTTNVTKNRLLHGSTFLNKTSSILVYGGSQNGLRSSSETFAISTNPPYRVDAFTSTAPAVANPLILPWNASHALMLGGSSQNKDLFTFGPVGGWHQLNVSLDAGLPNSNKVQGALMSADDGSKVLELFDLSVSPNKISTLLAQNPTRSGSPTKPSEAHKPSSTSSASLGKVTVVPPQKAKRAASLVDRPAYNSTLAPHITRSGFSLAQGADGLIVVSGGNDQEVLSLFDDTGNQWIDPDQFFAESKVSTPSSTPSSLSPAASLTAKPSPSSTGSPAAAGSPKNRSLTILGATLGAVFGVAALLVLLLLLLRFLRKRKGDKRRSSEYPMDDKHDMDFVDQGADFMKEAGGSFGKEGGHRRDLSGQSASSVVIMGGKRNSSQQSKRALFHKPGISDGSGKSIFGRPKQPNATSPAQIHEPFMNKYPDQATNAQTSPNPRTEPRTDTGWSKYWNNSSSNINAMAAAGPARHGSQQSRYTSTSQSDYDSSRIASSRITSSQPHDSAEVRPLTLSSTQLPPNATRVVSPTSGLPLQPGLAVSHNEPPTPTTIVSDIDEEDEYRLHNHHSLGPEGTSSWTPVDTSDRGSTWQDRPVSSIYTDSMIYPHPGERVRIPNFPGVPSRRPSRQQQTPILGRKSSDSRPKTSNPQQQSNLGRSNSNTQNNFSRHDSVSSPNRGMRSAAARDFMTPSPQAPAAPAQDPPNTRRVLPGYGAHEARTFPRRAEELGLRGRGGAETEDMSWLNLGNSK